MKIEQFDDYIRIENNHQVIVINSDGFTVNEKNHTLDELIQLLINDLYERVNNKQILDDKDVELIKILFEHN